MKRSCLIAARSTGGAAVVFVAVAAMWVASAPQPLRADSGLASLRGASEPTKCFGIDKITCDSADCGNHIVCIEQQNNQNLICTPIQDCNGAFGCLAGSGADCCPGGVPGPNCATKGS